MAEYKQTGKGGRVKQCKHCDVMFLRPDDTPTPDDACTRCYEEVEALKAKDKKSPNKPLLREKLNSFFKAVITRLQRVYWVVCNLTWDDFKRTIRGER